jgi:hypothetical protein
MADEKKKRHEFYVLAPMMSVQAVKDLTAALVTKGYTVGPLSSDEELYSAKEGNLVVIGQLRVTRSVPGDEKDPRQFVHREIKDTIKDLGYKYYMLFVGEVAMCTWEVGNMVPPDKKDETIHVGPYR